MPLEPPGWWSHGVAGRTPWQARALSPFGWLYGGAVRLRFAWTTPYRSRLPVVCIGNFTMGGAGKTPLALSVADALRELGARPAFLSRGYGGRLRGPHPVDPGRDEAADVGDEPLLLAAHAPTVVSRDRPQGARLIESLSADAIVMDDGFQNPSLAKDLCLVAVDGGTGLGNGRVFPAGPLRAPLAFQMARADAIVVIGERAHGAAVPQIPSVPVLHARVAPAESADWLRARRVLAFCGIGRPGKFFATLEGLGADLAQTRAFPDHHAYTAEEARALMQDARSHGATLATTEKDLARLRRRGEPFETLLREARALPIRLDFSESDRTLLADLLRAAIDGRKAATRPAA